MTLAFLIVRCLEKQLSSRELRETNLAIDPGIISALLTDIENPKVVIAYMHSTQRVFHIIGEINDLVRRINEIKWSH